MSNWMTAEAIGERYRVGLERLLAYAARGNLPIRRVLGEPPLFDESVVARIFRPRGAMVVSYREPSGPHLGILGVQVMGARPGESSARNRKRVPSEAVGGTVEALQARRIAG